MSIKRKYDKLSKILLSQGVADVDGYIDEKIKELMKKGKAGTHAGALSILLRSISVTKELYGENIEGWFLHSGIDNFDNTRSFFMTKDGVVSIRDKVDLNNFTPVVIKKMNKCVNEETENTWFEIDGFEERSDRIVNLLGMTTKFDDIMEQDYYLVSGIIKYVNAPTIWKNNEKVGQGQIYDGDKFKLRLTITDEQGQSQMNVTIMDINQIISLWPDERDVERPEQFMSWFKDISDNERLDELRKVLWGEAVLVLGRGSRMVNDEMIKNPFLVVGPEGFIVCSRIIDELDTIFDEDMLGEPEEEEKEDETPTTTEAPKKGIFIEVQEEKTTADNVEDAVIELIKKGEGTKEAFTSLSFMKGYSLDDITETVKKLLIDGKVVKQGNKIVWGE